MAEKSVKVKIIGSGDAFCSGGKLNTCFYVEADEVRLLVDCGATSLAGLKQQNVDLSRLDMIILTHFHGDHYGGLPFVLLEMAILQQRKEKLILVSPPGLEKRLKELMNLLYPGTQALKNLNLEYRSYKSKEVLKLDGIEIYPVEVKHVKESKPHGFRLKIGVKTLAFSGDTEWTNELIELAEGADLFICECNFYDQQISGHINYKRLEKELMRLNCKRLLINHLGTEMLKRKDELKVEVAEDGMVVEV